MLFICKDYTAMDQFRTTEFHQLHCKSECKLPEKFTFPFYYEPHELSVLAANQLQSYLETQTDFIHNFGLQKNQEGLIIGKMFGVMVVQNTQGKLGYLAAFSGKLADSNDIKGFVPTVYNNLSATGFYKQGEIKLNQINSEIENLENSQSYSKLVQNVEDIKSIFDSEIDTLKGEIKTAKIKRNELRETEKNRLSVNEYYVLLKQLDNESISYQLKLKYLKKHWHKKLNEAEAKLNGFQLKIETLKNKRASLSASLQTRLHKQYQFLNANGIRKNLLDIFKDTNALVPPAGSGECAAPKLFQYAFENKLKPISMAEFWWGASPKSQVRKHQQFYPSCRSKCEPILGHMMQGLLVDENPINRSPVNRIKLNIVYEDDYLMLINKPHEFLSVPGKSIAESVYSQLKVYLPNATGPLLVHRLDMSTSGLLLIAKSMRTYKQLQKQFIERQVTKRYVAVLDGVLTSKTGTINLPLRVDLDNRPQQLVCDIYGKPAETHYQLINIENGKSRVYFYPITGRTHQLRVHAAHQKGLKLPIIGDDLYGKKANRLHLHAENITFTHPIYKKQVTISCKVPF